MRIPLVITAVLAAFLSGCATTLRFNYRVESRQSADRGVTLSVGEVRNATRFREPDKIRFNVKLDRSVAQAVREAIVAELQMSGYRIGEGARRVSAIVNNFGFDRDTMIIDFSIESVVTGAVLHVGSCSEPDLSTSIFDAEGIQRQLRTCILKFIRDPRTQAVLDGKPLPELGAPLPSAEPAVAAKPPAPAVIESDVDRPKYSRAEDPEAYAVVIGVEKYQGLPDASFAERDASAMRDHFVALGVPQRHVNFLTGIRASRAGISKTVETWLPRNAGPNSTVYFYYSGHGAPDPRTGRAYLVPADGDPQYLEDTGYPLDRLYQKLGAVQARRAVVLIDSCFSGAGGRSVLAKGARPLVVVSGTAPPQDGLLTVLSASKADEVSGAFDEKKHGLFTYYLLRGLNGDARDGSGRTSVRSLYDYLRPKVEDAARRENREQTPQLIVPAGASSGFSF